LGDALSVKIGLSYVTHLPSCSCVFRRMWHWSAICGNLRGILVWTGASITRSYLTAMVACVWRVDWSLLCSITRRVWRRAAWWIEPTRCVSSLPETWSDTVAAARAEWNSRRLRMMDRSINHRCCDVMLWSLRPVVRLSRDGLQLFLFLSSSFKFTSVCELSAAVIVVMHVDSCSVRVKWRKLIVGHLIGCCFQTTWRSHILSAIEPTHLVCFPVQFHFWNMK